MLKGVLISVYVFSKMGAGPLCSYGFNYQEKSATPKCTSTSVPPSLMGKARGYHAARVIETILINSRLSLIFLLRSLEKVQIHLRSKSDSLMWCTELALSFLCRPHLLPLTPSSPSCNHIQFLNHKMLFLASETLLMALPMLGGSFPPSLTSLLLLQISASMSYPQRGKERGGS